jgi:hypothetical protein
MSIGAIAPTDPAGGIAGREGRLSAIARGMVRAVMGLLVAGLLAQFTVFLPAGWQGPPLLYGILAVCLTGALFVGRRRGREP